MKPQTRKEEILQVAAQLFKARGYSAVTMRDLAAAMDIKAASLYNHIASKQDILQDIILSVATQFTQAIQGVINEDSTSLKKLKAVIQLHVTIAVNNPNGMAALNSDWMHLDTKINDYFLLRNQYETHFRSILQQGIKQNEIKKVNIEVLVFSMLSTLRSLYLWIPKQKQQNINQLTNDLYSVLVEGITNP